MEWMSATRLLMPATIPRKIFGLCTEAGFRALCEWFPTGKCIKDLVCKHAADIENAKYFVRYRDRFLYIKRMEIDLFRKTGYAYVAEDMDALF